MILLEPGFENSSNKELVHVHNTTKNEYLRQDILLEMNRRLINEIKEFNKTSSNQTKKVIKLTEWIISLTIVLALGVAIQIRLLIIQIKITP